MWDKILQFLSVYITCLISCRSSFVSSGCSELLLYYSIATCILNVHAYFCHGYSSTSSFATLWLVTLIVEVQLIGVIIQSVLVPVTEYPWIWLRIDTCMTTVYSVHSLGCTVYRVNY